MNASDARTLSPAQVHRLRELHAQVSPSANSLELVQQLADRITRTLETRVTFLAERHGRWTVLAQAPADSRPSFDNAEAHASIGAFASRDDRSVGLSQHDDIPWTLVRLAGRRAGRIVLAIEGDWSASEEALLEFADTLLTAPALPSDPPRLDTAGGMHRLATALAAVSGVRQVCDEILRLAVEVVPSRLAAIAVPVDDGGLSIVATYGYSLALVEHLRIAGGAGVIGAVYQSATPLLVADVTAELGVQHRRHRYRTKSFIAVPIRAGGDVLAVLCMTDRSDDRPFDHGDVATLDLLLAPAVLALQRERVHRDAESYAHAAMTDPVSGIFNRWYFHARLDEELHRAARHGAAVGVLMIDIDRFKGINDTHGHQAGDVVIKNVAHILRGSVRLFDVCARFGGDEFAVIMPDSTIESACAIAERIRQRIENFEHGTGDLAHLRVTVSLGASVSESETGAHDLVHRADQALYSAKRAGTNRVHAISSGGTALELHQ